MLPGRREAGYPAGQRTIFRTEASATEPPQDPAAMPDKDWVIVASGGARGMASDIEIQAREILRIRERMNDLYVKYTGQSLTDIEKAMDRDTFLDAEEAMKFGIVDKVFETRPETEESEENEGSGGAPD